MWYFGGGGVEGGEGGEGERWCGSLTGGEGERCSHGGEGGARLRLGLQFRLRFRVRWGFLSLLERGRFAPVRCGANACGYGLAGWASD